MTFKGLLPRCPPQRGPKWALCPRDGTLNSTPAPADSEHIYLLHINSVLKRLPSRSYFINHYTKSTSWEDPRVRYQQIGKSTTAAATTTAASVSTAASSTAAAAAASSTSTASRSFTHHGLSHAARGSVDHGEPLQVLKEFISFI